MDPTPCLMRCICISERIAFNDGFLKIGEPCVVDPSTIYMDSDGDAYGMVYKKSDVSMENGRNSLLKHFCTIGRDGSIKR